MRRGGGVGDGGDLEQRSGRQQLGRKHSRANVQCDVECALGMVK